MSYNNVGHLITSTTITLQHLMCVGIQVIYIYAVLPPLTCAVKRHLFCDTFISCCPPTCKATDRQNDRTLCVTYRRYKLRYYQLIKTVT